MEVCGCGGAYEYVAAFNKQGGENLKYGADAKESNFAQAGGSSTQYATAYESENYNQDGNKVYEGDATKEVWMNEYEAWFFDYSYFVSTSNTFFRRGGDYGDTWYTGVFCADCFFGDISDTGSFRVVLVGA